MERIPRNFEMSQKVNNFFCKDIPFVDTNYTMIIDGSVNSMLNGRKTSKSIVQIKNGCLSGLSDFFSNRFKYSNLLSCKKTNSRSSLKLYFERIIKKAKYRNILIPTVYADSVESPTTTKPIEADKQQTTVERLRTGPRFEKDNSFVTDKEVRAYIENETGMDRLKMVFTRRSDNTYHPDLMEMVNNVKLYMVAIFFAAAITGGRRAKAKFIRKNQGTKWETRFQAARAAQDAMFIGGIKEGFKWGSRMLVFSSIFLSSSKAIAVYRNKTSFIEYSVAGGIAGSVLRSNLGLRGMLAGGTIASFLGLIAGIVMYGLQKYLGETEEIRHYWYITELLENEKNLKKLSEGKQETKPTENSNLINSV